MAYYLKRNGARVPQTFETKDVAIKAAKLFGVERVYCDDNGVESWFLVKDPNTVALKEVAEELERQSRAEVASSEPDSKSCAINANDESVANEIADAHKECLVEAHDAEVNKANRLGVDASIPAKAGVGGAYPKASVASIRENCAVESTNTIKVPNGCKLAKVIMNDTPVVAGPYADALILDRLNLGVLLAVKSAFGDYYYCVNPARWVLKSFVKIVG